MSCTTVSNGLIAARSADWASLPGVRNYGTGLPVVTADCKHLGCLTSVEIENISCKVRRLWPECWVIVEFRGICETTFSHIWAIEKIVDAHLSYGLGFGGGGMALVLENAHVRRQFGAILGNRLVFDSTEAASGALEKQKAAARGDSIHGTPFREYSLSFF